MIELLVVIAIIGVLAAAVLSAINPVEQINKGRDTRLRSDSAEVVNASERYYAVQEFYPWNSDSDTTTWDPVIGGVDYTEAPELEFIDDGVTYPLTFGWLYILQETSEVKAGFADRVVADVENFFLYKQPDDGNVYCCFLPRSNQFREEARKKCADGITPVVDDGASGNLLCPDDTEASAANYICVP